MMEDKYSVYKVTDVKVSVHNHPIHDLQTPGTSYTGAILKVSMCNEADGLAAEHAYEIAGKYADDIEDIDKVTYRIFNCALKVGDTVLMYGFSFVAAVLDAQGNLKKFSSENPWLKR